MLSGNKLANNIKHTLKTYYKEQRINPNHLYIMANNTLRARILNQDIAAARLPANTGTQRRHNLHENRIAVWYGILNIAKELKGSRRNVGNVNHINPTRKLIQKLKRNIPNYSYPQSRPQNRYNKNGTGNNYVNKRGMIHTI
jgi:hypothetical protein